jgi:hypothetical protein
MVVPRKRSQNILTRARRLQGMADESVLDEIQDNTKEAGQRLRASLNLLRAQGMLDDANYLTKGCPTKGELIRRSAHKLVPIWGDRWGKER